MSRLNMSTGVHSCSLKWPQGGCESRNPLWKAVKILLGGCELLFSPHHCCDMNSRLKKRRASSLLSLQAPEKKNLQ